jgi:hypothetical protein
MSDQPEFTDLLDQYIQAKHIDDQWSPIPESQRYFDAHKIYIEARTALNDYMLFMRRLAHSHPDILGPGNAETDI